MAKRLKLNKAMALTQVIWKITRIVVSLYSLNGVYVELIKISLVTTRRR